MPATTTASTPPNDVIEHDGMLWKPKRGATASFEEFIAARTTFNEITTDARWSPWVREDRQDEYERALEVMDQWRRAEPGHRMLTNKQLEARWARDDRKRARIREKVTKDREARKLHYDKDRADARLALAEQQSHLPHDESELAGYGSGSLFPKMDPARRQAKIDELKESIAGRHAEIERLSALVGDPETVVDENGWLPRERREFLLSHYRFDRERKVKRLRAEAADLEATADRKDQAKVGMLRRELDQLLAVPPLSADDMCSDCPVPLAEHGWRTMSGPCVAWPGPRGRLQRAREILAAGIREAEAAKGHAPPPPKPEPLAIIKSGLPIAEITQQLAKLQKQFPDAEVRRGRANRWELWPRDP